MLQPRALYRPPAQQSDRLAATIATAMKEQQATVNGVDPNVAGHHPHRSVDRHCSRGNHCAMIDLSKLDERSRVDVGRSRSVVPNRRQAAGGRDVETLASATRAIACQAQGFRHDKGDCVRRRQRCRRIAGRRLTPARPVPDADAYLFHLVGIGGPRYIKISPRQRG